MSIERAGRDLPIMPQELGDKVIEFVQLARNLDLQLFEEADEIAPLYPNS